MTRLGAFPIKSCFSARYHHLSIRFRRQPRLFFEPRQALGKTVGAAGQAAILLSLRAVIPLDETRVDGVTDWRLGQSGGDGRPIPKDHSGVNRRDPSSRSLLDRLGIPQVGTRSASGFGSGTARPAPRGAVPFPMDVQQRWSIGRPSIAGEKRDGVIGHPPRPARAIDPRWFDRVCRSQTPTPSARPGPTPTTPRRPPRSQRNKIGKPPTLSGDSQGLTFAGAGFCRAAWPGADVGYHGLSTATIHRSVSMTDAG